ncbi:SusC/RagA family TonB-linked outer membrane protein [Mucilaginibacter sp. UYCu711]|uniref:SusC/RagA family TonB-linked outer membrane protein n=1 Tax=Mucilaginibacter sp. UYCu711 TaxID=3156339 RepID=UPI003D20422D
MKLTSLLLIAIILQVSATTLAQKVTLNEKNAPLGQIFDKISAQTGYDFLFTTTLLKGTKPVSVNVTNADLTEVLKQIFNDQPLEFSIEDKAVVVSPKQKTILEKLGNLFALPVDVKGRVIDSLTGDPLSGATVRVKGLAQGTKTGTDGSFFLPNVEENAILVITFVGYKSQEIQASKDVGVVRLGVAVGNLQEVGVTVNTGYQRIRPEQSTGAVSQIGTKDYESRISTNFLDGLVNRLPGLMINNDVAFTSTTPGSPSSNSRSLFNIRGISTMSANQSPLIVIDGYPTELTIDMIDPNEIKTVTILKDAAAATVYGVRASNGVIVIERKKAVAGKPKFTFRATTGITPKENYNRYRIADDESAIVVNYQKTIYSKSIDATTWSQMSTIGSNSRSTFSPVYYIIAQSAAKVITPDQAASSYAALQNYDNREDYSKLFLRPAVTQTYNLNVSGGSDNALYYVTANYTRNGLQQIQNDNNRFSLSGRSTLKLSNRLSLELTMDYQEQRFNSAPVPDFNSFPYEHFQDVNGRPLAISNKSLFNPFYNNALMSRGLENTLYYPLIDVNEQNDKTHTVNNRITANFNYNIGNGFGLLFGGIYETSKSDTRHYASANSSQAKQIIDAYIQLNTDGTLKYNIPKGGYLNQETDNTTSYTTRAQLNYNKRISKHSFNGILGAEVRDVISKSNQASYFGYSDETLLQQPVDYAGIFSGITRSSFSVSSPVLFQSYSNLFNQQYTEDRFLSGYGNMVYSFKDTYSLTGSARVDQSNLFGTNPKYKYKPLWSIGAAWNIDKEAFMQDINWVDQLKLRSAYGFNGNVAKLSLPQAIAQYVLNPYTSPSSTALKLFSYANSSLRWEQTRNFNIGLDYRVFKNFTGSIDYYIKNSTDLLGNSQIDPTIGVSPSIINKASIRNNGLEFSLHADWIAKKDFNWNTGLVISHNTSKVLDVYQNVAFTPEKLNVLGYVKGYPVGALFAYRDAGLNSAGYAQIQNQNGKIYQTDNNSPGSPQTAIMSSDTSGVIRYMGSAIPTINAGLSNRVDIGNFYVFAMINYYGGFKVRVPRPNPSAARPLPGAGNYWKAPGDENTTDVMSLTAFSTSFNSNSAYNFSDKYVVNGDYITLGDLTLSYSLDDTKFIKKLGFNHFEIKCQGSNLWTHGFNKYNYSASMGSYQKSYLTPTYTLGIFTNF